MSKRVTSEVLQKAIELLMAEIQANVLDVANVVDMSAANADALGDEKNKVTTVQAVYNAVKSANHAGFKFVKAVDGKTFEETMEGLTPSELTFYVFKENDTDTEFDLYIYDSQQGKYVCVGGIKQTPVDTSLFWTKEELNKEEFALKTELPDMTEYTKTVDLHLDNYVTKEEYGEALTVEEVQTMFNNIKNGTTPSV